MKRVRFALVTLAGVGVAAFALHAWVSADIDRTLSSAFADGVPRSGR